MKSFGFILNFFSLCDSFKKNNNNCPFDASVLVNVFGRANCPGKHSNMPFLMCAGCVQVCKGRR